MSNIKKTLIHKPIILIFASTLLFGACATKKSTAPQTDDEKLATLQEGRTTDDEVRVVFGIPDAILTRGKSKTWVYRDKNDSKEQTYQLPNGFQGQGIILTFDGAGILKEHKHITAEQVKAAKTQAASENSEAEIKIRTADPKPAASVVP